MESYDVVVCSRCGLAYADNIPAQEEFNTYYALMSKYEFDYNAGVVAQDYIAQYTKIVDFISPHIKSPDARILDIGCSTGALLSVFKSRGYRNLLGLDPSSSCVEVATRLYGVPAVAGDISGFRGEGTYDLIILSAVLEHLVDFEYSMKKIQSLLSDNGLLFIEVPDVERFQDFVSAPFQQFSVEHINYFSRFSISNLLSAYSFNALEMQQNESILNMTTDPDLFVLSKKSSNSPQPVISPDSTSEPSLLQYIELCAEIDLRIRAVISEKLLHLDRFIVWGAGTHTQRLIGAGLDTSKILYIVDSNKRYTGKKLDRIEIRLPQDITEDVPILISTYSYQSEIANMIRNDLKLGNDIVTLY
jgi:SAM-dependent methyltransferase